MFFSAKGSETKHYDIKSRLLWSLAIPASLLMLLLWLGHGLFMERLAREQSGERLQQEADYLIQRLDWQQSPPQLDDSLLRSGYYQDIYHHFYVVRIGKDLLTTHPKWHEAIASLENVIGLDEVRLSQGQRLLVYGVVLQPPLGVKVAQPAMLWVAEDITALSQGLWQLHGWVGGIALVLLVVLLTVNGWLVARGLAPLRQIAAELQALQQGQRVSLSAQVPEEVKGLVDEINLLVSHLQQRIEQYRHQQADLSHGLKTPLAAMMQALQVDTQLAPERRQQLLQRCQWMNDHIQAALKRSRLSGPRVGAPALSLATLVPPLWQTMQSLYQDRPQLQWQLQLPPGLALRMDQQDALELLGNLLDNAGKWAHQRIRLRACGEQQSLCLELEDDGPGVAAERWAELGQRGARLDESRPGQGLGLAIAKEILQLYGADWQFGQSEWGGLRVRLYLPLQRTDAAPSANLD
ncbi:sensor histidine kinase [Balneatrix alpica]|uniref:sensor histidine kinase n=1 Tax=Balneatrix alpica TaxID=75684 RepID=UPI0027383FF1|nr:sensor histidine kinase [Balneatrix alpica]